MGKVLYCETKESETPYIFPNTRIAVYSYEEVCYYIFQNSSMITRQVLSHPFTDWVSEKLGLTELAEETQKLVDDPDKSLRDILQYFLLAYNYYSGDEVALLFEQMKEMSRLPEYERLKRQADTYLRFKKIFRAVNAYRSILEMDDLPDEFRSGVCHNIGVALSRNFELDQAAGYFQMAYIIHPNDVSLIAYLSVFFMLRQDDRAREAAAELGVTKEHFEKIRNEYLRTEDGYKETDEYRQLEEALSDLNYGQNRKAVRRITSMVDAWKDEERIQID